MSKHRGEAMHKYCETYDMETVEVKKEGTEEEYGIAIQKLSTKIFFVKPFSIYNKIFFLSSLFPKI